MHVVHASELGRNPAPPVNRNGSSIRLCCSSLATGKLNRLNMASPVTPICMSRRICANKTESIVLVNIRRVSKKGALLSSSWLLSETELDGLEELASSSSSSPITNAISLLRPASRGMASYCTSWCVEEPVTHEATLLKNATPASCLPRKGSKVFTSQFG